MIGAIRTSSACALPLLGLLLICTAGCPAAVTSAEDGITPDPIPEGFAGPADEPQVVECFHRELGDEGTWERQEPYGEVWEPPVPEDWRPYTDGYWADTDQGWGWVANEPWGWAVFHYGRWVYGPKHRWLWVPGTRWAPAWVAWRTGGGYVGWAPLPPAVGFVDGRGLDRGTGSIHPTHFTFVSESALLSHDLRHAILPPGQGSAIAGRTLDVTRYKVVHHRILDLGPNPGRIAAVTGQPMERLKVGRLAATTGAVHSAFYHLPELATRGAGAARREFGSALRAQAPARPETSPGARPTSPQRSEVLGSRSAPIRTPTGGRAWNVAAGPRPSYPAPQTQARSFPAHTPQAEPFQARASQPTRSRSDALQRRSSQGNSFQPRPYQGNTFQPRPYQGNAFQPRPYQGDAFRARSFQATPRQTAPRQPAPYRTRPETPMPSRYQPQPTGRFQSGPSAPQFQRRVQPAMPQPAPRASGPMPSGGHRRPPA
jgi:hypothetical protein